jgi:aspartate 1-decarboxylase
MLLTIMKSKIHRATVTEAVLEYEGSITIDESLMIKANLLPFEKVQVLNMNNGERFETYVIKGDKDTGVICLNGPAARLGYKGDEVVIISYVMMDKNEYDNYQPLIVLVDKNNRIADEH